MQIAILGGGVTGLAAAHALSRRFPAAHILLLESTPRLGGWLQSELVVVHNYHRILVERGPRTLRPQGSAVLDLIRDLHIDHELITVPRTADAARHRYVYLPPGRIPHFAGLLNLGMPPSLSLLKWLLSDTFSSFCSLGLAKFATGGPDESVHAWLSRLLSKDLADTLGSAFCHGVYAADSRQLSAHAARPRRRTALTPPESAFANALHKSSSVYSFKHGLQTLPRALEQYLQRQPNVQILCNSPVLRLCIRKDHTFELSSSIATVNPTHVVSALPLPVLHAITQSTTPIPHLLANSSSTVHVLSLVFPTPPREIHPPGFGYLIPRPKHGYPTHSSDDNPGILGVVFDSCSTWQQDEPGGNLTADEWYHKGSHTKITVMLGGPYPLYIPPSVPPSLDSSADIPRHIQIILNHISTHLNRSTSFPSPIYYRLWRNEDCIPTYNVGHLRRIQDMRDMLNKDPSEGGWGGKLDIVGAGVEGVSVPDCVLAGRNAGLRWL